MNLLFELSLGKTSDSIKAAMGRRHASRGVVLDDSGRVCLMHATKPGYFKLPGGGIEGDEKPEEAFIRECAEETGYRVKIVAKLGIVEEYRTDINRHQTSYCFTGKIVGEQESTDLDEGEAAEGFQPEWFSQDKALAALRASSSDSKRIIVERDARILEIGLGQATGSR
jgi:8-oxo-dGTP pyrophosphatase MutT (NUDIX family)